MRQPPDDRALYYRQLRATVANVFVPELHSALAIDAAGLVDRILAEFVVEEEWAVELGQEFGSQLARLLGTGAKDLAEPDATVNPEQFRELRRRAAEVVAAKAGNNDPGDRALCHQLVEVEHRFLKRVDELRCAVFAESLETDARAELTGTSVSADQVTDYLRRRFPLSPNLAVTSLEVVPGGRSKETLVLRLSGTNELPAEVIVRKDRAIGVLETRAADEFAILQAVHARRGVPVAEPFLCDDITNGLGDGEGTFVVMARVPGHKAGEYFPELAAPAQHREALGAQLATALAHLHTVELDELSDTNLDTTAQVSEDTVRASVEAMAARIGELSGPPIVAVPEARQWLLEHVGDVVPCSTMCLLQGDVGLHNMLIDGDRLTALVDWEAASIGPPARELAAAWLAATALTDWDAFIGTYLAAGGPPDATDERAVTFYRVFFALGACMSSRIGGHLFRTGSKRDLVTAHSGLDAHFRAQRNLARALGDALGAE